MKIAIVVTSTKDIPHFRLDMAKAFLSKGHQVLIAGDESLSDWTNYFSEHGMGYRQFFVSRAGTNPFEDLKTLRSLTELFLREKPEKVFTANVKANIYGSIAAHRAGIRDIYVMMGGLGSVFRSEKPGFVTKLVSLEYKYSLRYAKKVFFQNKEDKELFVSLDLLDESKVVMTRGSGVNVRQFERRPMPDGISFLFVGRLVKGKGVFEYLEAARLVKRLIPEAKFHLVGPFDDNPTSLKPNQLRPYVDDGTVEYHGEQSDVRPFLERCTCFVLPSYYGEGTPKSALEAMATGRPLVVANAVGTKEVVRDGINGFLVEPRNIDDLAKKMIELASNPLLAKEMGQASRALALAVYDVRLVNEVILSSMGLQ